MDEASTPDSVEKPAQELVNLVTPSTSDAVSSSGVPAILNHDDVLVELPLESFALVAVRYSVIHTALIDAITILLFAAAFLLPPVGTVGMMFAIPALRQKIIKERVTYDYESSTNIVTTKVWATHARTDSALRFAISMLFLVLTLLVCFMVFRWRNAAGAVVGLFFTVGFVGLRSFQYLNPVGYVRWLLSMNRRKNPDSPVLKGEIQ